MTLLINHPETKFPIVVLCSHCLTSFPLGDCDDAEYIRLLERARTCCECDVEGCSNGISSKWSLYCTTHREDRQALDAARRAEQDKLDEIEGARIAALTPVELDREQTMQLLRDTMSECQEDISCSSWEEYSTEFILWRQVMYGGEQSRMSDTQQMEAVIVELRALARKLNGWHLSDRFVPMVEWLGMFTEYVQKYPEFLTPKLLPDPRKSPEESKRIRDQATRLGVEYPEDKSVREMRGQGFVIDPVVPDDAWYIQVKDDDKSNLIVLGIADDGYNFIWAKDSVLRSAEGAKALVEWNRNRQKSLSEELPIQLDREFRAESLSVIVKGTET